LGGELPGSHIDEIAKRAAMKRWTRQPFAEPQTRQHEHHQQTCRKAQRLAAEKRRRLGPERDQHHHRARRDDGARNVDRGNPPIILARCEQREKHRRKALAQPPDSPQGKSASEIVGTVAAQMKRKAREWRPSRDKADHDQPPDPDGQQQRRGEETSGIVAFGRRQAVGKFTRGR
jgi:hypothetical protein